MIEERVSIHDKFSIEFKLGFAADKELDINNFSFNMWMFVPNSLDINKYTYSKSDFYIDLKSKIRLITPIYLLRDINNEENLPLKLLKESFLHLVENPNQNQLDYEMQIKMFQSIFKSALRNEILHIQQCQPGDDKKFLVESCLHNVVSIAKKYRELNKIINVPVVEKSIFEYFAFGDEFMSDVIESSCFNLLKHLDNFDAPFFEKERQALLNIINEETDYKKSRKFLWIDKNSTNKNRDFVNRFSSLKKYIESQLFLQIKSREDGVIAKQISYSLAAGISMIFATIIAFVFQQKYGNFTTTLFFALVIGYMFKDRIKELARIFFAHRVNNKYFDTKTDIRFNNVQIGNYKESQTFVKDHQLPEEVIRLRNRPAILAADNRTNDEKIIFYRLHTQLYGKKIKETSRHPVAGINNFLQFNLSRFIQKMEDVEVPLYVTDDAQDYKIIHGEKVYYLNFILRFKQLDKQEYKRYRIMFNRDGIKQLETF